METLKNVTSFQAAAEDIDALQMEQGFAMVQKYVGEFKVNMAPMAQKAPNTTNEHGLLSKEPGMKNAPWHSNLNKRPLPPPQQRGSEQKETPKSGWMSKVIPLVGAILMADDERTRSIGFRLSEHFAIKEYVSEHVLTMQMRGKDPKYQTD